MEHLSARPRTPAWPPVQDAHPTQLPRLLTVVSELGFLYPRNYQQGSQRLGYTNWETSC